MPGEVLYLQVADSFVVKEIVVPVVPIDRAPDGAAAERTGAVLSIVIVTDEDVVVFPAASRATAVNI